MRSPIPPFQINLQIRQVQNSHYLVEIHTPQLPAQNLSSGFKYCTVIRDFEIDKTLRLNIFKTSSRT